MKETPAVGPRRVKKTASTPLYAIGAAVKLTGLSAATLRWVEKQGLMTPARTGGRQRLFSDEDIAEANEVRLLLEEHVNLPGIRIILELRARLARYEHR